MKQLNNSSLSTLNGIKNELDNLQGKQENVERRQYESRNRSLKAELAQAKAKGDGASVSNLSQALSINQSIYSEKRRQQSQQQQEQYNQKREQQRREKEKSRINPTRQPSRSTTPEKIIRLEYPGGSVNVGVNRNDEAKLLQALKSAGMRSI